MRIYRPTLCGLRVSEVRRYAGLQQSKLDNALVDKAVAEALALAEPRAVYEVCDYDANAHTVGDSLALEGKQIVAHIGDSREVVIMAATVGRALEDAVSRQFAAGRYAYAVLLDAAATAAVEQVADALESVIGSEAAGRGQSLKWRFSPGYGDWPLTAQPSMLRLSHAAAIGVALTPSLMLTPRKSVTALIALVAGTGKQGVSCAACPREACQYRAAPVSAARRGRE